MKKFIFEALVVVMIISVILSMTKDASHWVLVPAIPGFIWTSLVAFRVVPDQTKGDHHAKGAR